MKYIVSMSEEPYEIAIEADNHDLVGMTSGDGVYLFYHFFDPERKKIATIPESLVTRIVPENVEFLFEPEEEEEEEEPEAEGEAEDATHST